MPLHTSAGNTRIGVVGKSDVISDNATISACGKNGGEQMAVHASAGNTRSGACDKGGKWVKGSYIFANIATFSVRDGHRGQV